MTLGPSCPIATKPAHFLSSMDPPEKIWFNLCQKTISKNTIYVKNTGKIHLLPQFFQPVRLKQTAINYFALSVIIIY